MDDVVLRVQSQLQVIDKPVEAGTKDCVQVITIAAQDLAVHLLHAPGRPCPGPVAVAGKMQGGDGRSGQGSSQPARNPSGGGRKRDVNDKIVGASARRATSAVSQYAVVLTAGFDA